VLGYSSVIFSKEQRGLLCRPRYFSDTSSKKQPSAVMMTALGYTPHQEAIIDNQRAARYERLYEQLRGLIEDRSPSLQAAMATICAVLHAKMPHHFWTGFYFVKNEDELHVGPYQGPVACQILKGQGVCLHSARTGEPVVVPNVEAYPDHIACDSRSKSEIVIPVRKDGDAVAVLDVDSSELNQFSKADIEPLSKILGLLRPFL